jgi:hypothetical protein
LNAAGVELADYGFLFFRLSDVYGRLSEFREARVRSFGQNAVFKALKRRTLPFAFACEEQKHDSHAKFISYVLSI